MNIIKIFVLERWKSLDGFNKKIALVIFTSTYQYPKIAWMIRSSTLTCDIKINKFPIFQYSIIKTYVQETYIKSEKMWVTPTQETYTERDNMYPDAENPQIQAKKWRDVPWHRIKTYAMKEDHLIKENYKADCINIHP